MKRLFVALALPDPVRSQLAALCGGIPGARWVAPENLHITLRFIGEVDGALEADIADGLSGLRAERFTLRLEGVGQFGSGRVVRSVWAGVPRHPALISLQRTVDHLLAREGAAPDRRRFTPHVTLARFGNANSRTVADWLAAAGLFRTPPFDVRDVTLFESRIGRHGAWYTPVMSVPLTDPPP